MSTNEENTDPASVPAAATPAAPSDAAKSVNPAPATPPRTASRFYSRGGRGSAAPAAPKAASPAAEGLTPEEAIALNLKDNLPVRATMGDVAEFAPRDTEGGDSFGERRGRDRDRGGRGERGERSDRGERRGRDRGRDGERGRSRDFNRDQPRDDRGADAPRFEREPVAQAPASVEPSTPEMAAEAQSAPSAPEETPAPRREDRPRRVRFEDAPAEASSRSVQEFRPSRDRSYAEEAARNRAESAPEVEKPKSSGLFGWMKSILGGSGEPSAESTGTPSSDKPDRGPRDRGRGRDRRDRGPQGQQRGGHGGGGRGAGEGGEAGGPSGEGDGNRRRRRRRGGRNRNRDGGGGGGQGGGGQQSQD